jgi:hypothetical protein
MVSADHDEVFENSAKKRRYGHPVIAETQKQRDLQEFLHIPKKGGWGVESNVRNPRG